MKKIFFVSLLMTLVTTSAIAGNFDILAMEEFYNIVNSWLKDTHIVIIPSVILFCIGIWRAIAGSFVQTLLMCGFGVVTMQGLSIIESFNSI